MPIITLTSDMGNSDFYVAGVKAAILKDLPNACIVDITHAIDSFNIPSAAFIIKNIYEQFPEGTIHLVAVDQENNSNARVLAIRANRHCFIGADNGLFSLVFSNLDEVVLINIPADLASLSFTAKDIMTKAAVYIAKGSNISEIGMEHKNHVQYTQTHPIYDNDSVRTTILHTDKYGNCIFNLEKELFERLRRGRKFSIDVKGESITAISRNYNDIPGGNLIALFTSYGLLELSISFGNFSQLLGFKMGNSILINFFD